MLKRWKKLASKTIHENPWWTYKRDEFQIPDGIQGEYYSVYTRGASLIIPVLDDGRVILVNQYRYLCDKESLELPCGGVKEGKTYEEMASIELQEETGYKARKLDYVAEFNPFNGVTNEICKVFLGSDLQRNRMQPDATEEFEILLKSKSEIDDMIRHNIIWDGMTIAAWGLARHLL